MHVPWCTALTFQYSNASVFSRNICTLEILPPQNELFGQIHWFLNITWHLSALGSGYLIDRGLLATACGSWEGRKWWEVQDHAFPCQWAGICLGVWHPPKSDMKAMKAQDASVTSTLLFLLCAEDGKHFARSCVQQLRHLHKVSGANTHPAHHPS